MTLGNVTTRLIAEIGKGEAIKYLNQYRPPSYNDILHDGLVQSGELVGGALGGAVGLWGGQTMGPAGAGAGLVSLGSLGHLAGGWAGHGAYLQGQVIKDIISHPQNWTVDAAGAIVPVMPPSAAPPDANYVWKNMPVLDLPPPPPRNPTYEDVFVRESAAAAGIPSRNNVYEHGFPAPGSVQSPLMTPGAIGGAGYVGSAAAPPIPFIPAAPQSAPGGLPGLLIEASLNDPLNPDASPPGGLVGLIQEYMRNSSRGSN